MRVRSKEQRESDLRLCAVALSFFAVFILALFTACASVPVEDDYEPPRTDSLVIHIENHRTIDANAPHFVLLGTGRYELGVVQGMGGRLTRTISSRWLGPNGCIRIIAHYVGLGDLVFDEACWRPGEKVTVSLDNIFVPGASWSHR